MHAVEVQLQLMTAKVTCMIAFTCTYTVVGVGDSSNIWAKCWSAFIWVKLSPVVCLSYLWIFQAPIAGSNKWRSGKATIYIQLFMELKFMSVFVYILKKHGVSDVFRLTTFCITYVAILVEFLLAFFPEPKPPSLQDISQVSGYLCMKIARSICTVN